MRTKEEFNQLYASPDPWGRALARCVRPFVANKTVLELGCGEGHLPTRSAIVPASTSP
jgi:hypothetical protein